MSGSPATPAASRGAASYKERARRRPAPARLEAPTKLAAFAVALAESSCLAAVLLVPAFFNIHSERIFEEDKIPLLRSLALCAFGAWAILLAERGSATLRAGGLSLWRLPLVRPVAALTAAYVLATILSVNPRLSFSGAYLRQQGLYTWLCYPFLFLSVVLLVRERRQVERLIAAMMLAGGVVALHALLQQLGYDPLPWGLSFEGRAYGAAGNPIFLGAFLIMTIPITLAWTLRAATSRSPRTRWPRVNKGIVVLACAVLLVVELASLSRTGSRGPVVGLAGALLLFGLLHAARRGWRRLTIAMLSLSLVAALLFGFLSFVASTNLTSTLGMSRVARLFDLQRGTGRVRVLIWQAANDAFTSNPWRAALGHGPETFLSVVNPYYPPELAYYESRKVLPDRAHNATLDALITTGLIGCAAETALFVAFFGYAFRALGLLPHAAQRRRFLGLAAAGAAAGAIVPPLLDDSLRFSGLGLSLGLFFAIVIFLVLRSLFPVGGVERRREPEKLLLTGLVAAAGAHLIETSVGIPLVATRLYFWISAGLVVVLFLRAERSAAAGAASASRALPWGFFVALTFIALTYDVYSPTVSARSIRHLLGLLVPVWLLGAFLAVSHAGTMDRRAVARFLLESVAPWALFAAPFIWWANHLPQGGADPMTTAVRFATSLTHMLSILYAAVFAVVVCAALVAVWRRGHRTTLLARQPWLPVAYAGFALATAVVVVKSNLDISRADMFSKQGRFYEGKKLNDTAARLFEEAFAMRPFTDTYAANLGRVLSVEASRLAPRNGAMADDHLRRAQAALERAYALRPRHLDHARNIARLHHLWASLLRNPEARAQQFAAAERWYERTLAVAPTHAAVLNEWALMKFELQETDRALQMLARSVEIDPHYTTTYWIRGNVRASTGDPEGALKDYDHALMLYDKLLPALSGKGAVLLRLGRIDDAIAVNRRALEINPNDFITRKNLAVLYRDKGALEDSLKQANRALGVAPNNEKEALRQFIADVEARRAAATSPEQELRSD